jgi:hypothetical protein
MKRVLLALAVLFVGCAAPAAPRPKTTPAKTAAISNTDPCAMRLHDISGALLLYYSTHRELPATLDELKDLGASEFTCPVSHQAYVYDPRGLPAPDGNARVVVYDAVAAHRGLRLAISVVPPEQGTALVTKVIALPPNWKPVTTPQP